MRFVDTNVLLYAVSKSPAESEKARAALELLQSTDLALSVQVLQEFYVQATRASKPNALTHAQATGLIEAFLRFPVQKMTLALMWAVWRPGGGSASHCRMRPSSRPPGHWAATRSCRKISATVRTTTEYGYETRSGRDFAARFATHADGFACALAAPTATEGAIKGRLNIKLK